MAAVVQSVHASETYTFSKPARDAITIEAGLGVRGDAHAGVKVKHRSRIARDPNQPNLRQVHLMHMELLAELEAKGFDVGPGALGENVTTAGIDLLALPTGTRLRLGADAIVEVTGLRNPCGQIERYRTGLLEQVLVRDADGNVERKTGVMSVVLVGGVIRPGDTIEITLPPPPHQALCVV